MAEWYSSFADILIHENITFPEKFIVSFVNAKKKGVYWGRCIHLKNGPGSGLQAQVQTTDAQVRLLHYKWRKKLSITKVLLHGINSNTVYMRAASFIWVLRGDNTNFILCHKKGTDNFALNCIYLDVSYLSVNLITFFKKMIVFSFLQAKLIIK